MIYGRLLAIGQFFVEVCFQPQQYFMYSCANMIHNIIKLYRDLWRATSHIQHLLRGLPASTVLHVCPFIHYTFVLRIAIMFLYDLGRATSHIQHLLKRASSLNSLTGLPIYTLYILAQKRICIAIMFLYNLGRSTSHIQHLLKRASCFNSH